MKGQLGFKALPVAEGGLMVVFCVFKGHMWSGITFQEIDIFNTIWHEAIGKPKIQYYQRTCSRCGRTETTDATKETFNELEKVRISPHAPLGCA